MPFYTDTEMSFAHLQLIQVHMTWSSWA